MTDHDNTVHNDLVRRMLAAGTYGTTGRYRDPVSGRLFPKGLAAKLDPSREERRRLERWRRTGRIRGGQVCPVVPELEAAAEPMLPPPSWWPGPIGSERTP